MLLMKLGYALPTKIVSFVAFRTWKTAAIPIGVEGLNADMFAVVIAFRGIDEKPCPPAPQRSL